MAGIASKLDLTISRIEAPDAAVAAQTQRAFDRKTKPRGSLGRLEELGCRVAAIRRHPLSGPEPSAVVVVAGDHGIAEEGVSAYPQEVTRQMLANFVDHSMQTGDLVAIVRTVSGKGVLQQFTTDKSLLNRAVAALTPVTNCGSAPSASWTMSRLPIPCWTRRASST